MLRKIAILFTLFSLFFILGHSFTVHSHKNLESENAMHQHQDFTDFISCLFSTNLGQSHLESFVASVENSTLEIQNISPELLLKAMIFVAVLFFLWKNLAVKRVIFSKNQVFFQSYYFSLLKGRAPPISLFA
jgi:hypothetical protein